MEIILLKKESVIAVVFLILFLVQCASADVSQGNKIVHLETHDIHLQTLSSRVFTVDCIEGEILYGEFVVTSDGDLYQGDQRKYDLWVGWGQGVDFYIFNQENYESWIDGETAVSFFERNDVNELSWSIQVDQTGLWYLVYVNDSPSYMKTVEGSINHGNNTDLLLIALFGVVGSIITIFIIWFLKFKKSS